MAVYDKNTDTYDSEKNTHVMYTLLLTGFSFRNNIITDYLFHINIS